MKKIIVQSLVVLLLLAGAGAQAAISVTNIGVGGTFTSITNAFTATPTAGDWGTTNFAGAAGTWAATGTMDSVVTNVTASTVMQSNLVAVAISPITVGLHAQRSSVSNNIQTKASGNNGVGLMARVINNTGADQTFLKISYTLGYGINGNAAAAEELPTFRAYYSMTGLAGSWTNIAGASGIGLGANVYTNVVVTVALSGTWTNGTNLYVMWVDDNGSATDIIVSMDNVVFSVPPVGVTLDSPANGISASTPAVVTLAATASGDTFTGVGFYATNAGSVVFLASDVTAPYSVSSSGLATGVYGVYAIATNSGAATFYSLTNLVTVTNLPLSAVVTTPTNTQTYLTNEAYLITGTAVGTDLSNVLFYVDGALVGSDDTAPYTFNASGLALGSHTVYAAATNNLNAVSYSLTNTFTVTNVQAALAFDGTSSYVTMKNVAGKGDFNSMTNFTVEFWFKRTGPGTPDVGGAGTGGLGSGAGGPSAIPMVARGDSEADGTTQDAAVYIGIVTNNGVAVLGGDFEALNASASPVWALGANFPVVATNEIVNNVWIHAALTYNCTNGTWNVYFNGVLDTTKTTNAAFLPRADSIQHLGLGANMNSAGTVAGRFAGQLDEVRLWSTVRTAAEVLANKNVRIISATGLVARYGLDEGSGTLAFDSAGSAVAGTLTGTPVWTTTNAFVPFSIAITDPTNTQIFAAPASVTVSATATSPNTITNVDFYKDGVLQGNDTTSPYSFALSTIAAAGSYALEAVVQDNSGARATSAVVNITVTSSAGATMVSPTDGQSYAAGSTVTFSAAGTGAGLVTNLTIYYTNGSVLVTTNSNDASVAISTNLLDQYPLTNAVYAVAIDDLGNVYISTTNTFSVTNVPIIATLTSPTQNQTNGQAQAINLTATVSGGVSPYSVQFFTNDVAAGAADVSSPYTMAVSYTTVSSYTAFANVTDAHGIAALTVTNTFYITNVPPSVVLTHPVNGAISNSPAIINLKATANGGGGTVTGVGYYYTNGGVLIFVGSSTTGPTYPVSTASLVAGSYGFYAIMTNSFAVTATSPINVVSVTTTLTFQNGAGGYTGFKATHLGADVPGTTNSGEVATTWKADGSPVRHGLIAFSSIFGSGSGQIPLGSTIQSATVTANYNDNSADSYGVFRMLVDWDPNVATWNSFTSGVDTNGIEAASAATIYFVNPGNNVSATYNAFTNSSTPGGIVADLIAWSGGTSNYGWVVIPTSGTSGWGWTGGGGPPILSVVFVPPPTPLSVVVTAPANGTSVEGPVPISLTATAAPGPGATVSSVAYYYTNSGVETYVGTSSSGTTYPVNTAVLALGSYGFYAYVTNSNGDFTNSVTNVVTMLASNYPPVVTLVAPANGATGQSTSPSLQVSVTDPEASNMTVTYYGRVLNTNTPGADFTIIAIPDTQNLVSGAGTPAMFNAIGDWVATNRASSNIVALLGLGDCTQNGNVETEWQIATNALYRVENPTTTGLAQGATYQVTVGNHDQGNDDGSPGTTGAAGSTSRYNTYFGTNHFGGKSYYGGHYGTNNDNHYILFSGGGLDFITISLEYNDSDAAGGTANSQMLTNVLAWADALLKTYNNRRGILVTHGLIGERDFGASTNNSAWTYQQGLAIFNALNNNTNLFLMLSGHHTTAPYNGRRYDTTNGRTLVTLMTDYQSDTNGGSGFVAIYTFSPANNVIQRQSYSPHFGSYKRGTNDQFTVPYNMAVGPQYAPIGTNTGVASGSTSSKTWAGLANGTTYEWYVVVSDGTNSVTGATNTFTTALISQHPVSVSTNVGSNATFSVTAGAAPVQYQWYFGGSPVSNATNSTLTLVNVQLGDVGGYNVFVTNNYGYQTSSVATLSVNQLPVAGTDTMGTEQNTAQTISEEKMLDNDSDADFGTLSVIGVSATSTNGGTVSSSMGVVTYTPVNGFAGVDQFSYSLSDGQGGVVVGLVNVTVTGATNTPPNLVSFSQPGGPGTDITLVFAGIPGRTYEIQATTNIAPASAVNWITLVTTNASTNAPGIGLFQYTDPSPLPSSRYYRTYAP